MLSVISWGIMAMASSVDKELMFIQLLVARFIIGICIGLSSAPSAVYSAEIAHPTLRGRFSVITSVTIGLGILFIYVLGYFIPVIFVHSSFSSIFKPYFSTFHASDFTTFDLFIPMLHILMILFLSLFMFVLSPHFGVRSTDKLAFSEWHQLRNLCGCVDSLDTNTRNTYLVSIQGSNS